MPLIDTHTHLDGFRRDNLLPDVLSRAAAAGLEAVVAVGTAPDDWGLYREIAAEQGGFVRFTVGLHPCAVDAGWEGAVAQIERYFTVGTGDPQAGDLGMALEQARTGEPPVPTFGHEASVPGHEAPGPSIGHEPPVLGHESPGPAIGHEVPVLGNESPGLRHEVPGLRHEAPVLGNEVPCPAIGHESPGPSIGHEMPVLGHEPPVPVLDKGSLSDPVSGRIDPLPGRVNPVPGGVGPLPVAIGECGLDRFHLPKEAAAADRILAWQKAAFEVQLGLAKKLGCALVVHSRGAFAECVDMIDASGVDWRKVVFHCFSEGPAEIAELVRRGGRGSFTGILTYKNAERVREAARVQGLGSLMLETDAPFLAPVPHRGFPNEPAYVRDTAEFAAGMFGVPFEELAAITTANARAFFGFRSQG